MQEQEKLSMHKNAEGNKTNHFQEYVHKLMGMFLFFFFFLFLRFNMRKTQTASILKNKVDLRPYC